MINRIALLLGAFLLIANLAFAQNADKEKTLAEPVATGENYKVFGSEFPEKVKFFAPGYLIRNANVFKGQQVATRGTITQVCQKKGCFFVLSAGDKNIRVTFKDYSFFIPKNSAGKDVRLVGTFRVKDLSEEQAKHYAEEAGENADKVEGDRKEYEVVAASVKIFDSEQDQ